MKMSAQNKGFTTFMKTERGFTLIELMVVISIIAILSMIGLTMYSSAQKASRDGKRRADIQAIQTALEEYRTDKGYYPGAISDWVCSSDPGSDWIPGLSSYLSNGIIPQDPQNTGRFYTSSTPLYSYCYYANQAYGGSPGGWYMLVVQLEQPTSTELATNCTAPNTAFFDYGQENCTGGCGDNGGGLGHSRMVCNQQ